MQAKPVLLISLMCAWIVALVIVPMITIAFYDNGLFRQGAIIVMLLVC